MFRRFRLRFRKAAVIAALAMGLSVSLVVSSPAQPAQAFVPPAVALAGPTVLGATGVALGTVATGALVATGVGLLVIAGGFVLAAHSQGVFKFPWEDNPANTEDSEVVQEVPADGVPKEVVEKGTGQNIRSTMFMQIGSPSLDGLKVNFPITYTGQIPVFSGTFYKSLSFMAALDMDCRNPDTGEMSEGTRMVYLQSWGKNAEKDDSGKTLVYTASCPNIKHEPIEALLRPMTEAEYASANSVVNGNGASTWRGPGSSVFWKAKGSPYTNPEMRTRVDCVAPDGTKTQLEATTPARSGEIAIPSCAEAGLGIAEKLVTDFLDDGQVRSQPMIELTPGATRYTDCDPSLGQLCKLEIHVDGKPCTVGDRDCIRWTQLARSAASRVQCFYGPNLVDIGLCGIMESAYVPGGSPNLEENLDGNPDTWVNPSEYPNWWPQIIGPEGKPIPDPNWKPGIDPYPDTGMNPNPNPGNPNPGTGTVPGVGGQPGADASANEKACFPKGWAMLNPVEWVMRPVGCALREAFIPKPQAVTEVSTRLQTRIEAVGFSNVSNAWLSTYESAGGGSGCMGPPVNFSMNGVEKNMHPFQACTAPMSTVAAVAFGVSSLVIVLFGGLGIIRAIGAAFGFNFSMGKGGDDD